MWHSSIFNLKISHPVQLLENKEPYYISVRSDRIANQTQVTQNRLTTFTKNRRPVIKQWDTHTYQRRALRSTSLYPVPHADEASHPKTTWRIKTCPHTKSDNTQPLCTAQRAGTGKVRGPGVGEIRSLVRSMPWNLGETSCSQSQSPD